MNGPDVPSSVRRQLANAITGSRFQGKLDDHRMMTVRSPRRVQAVGALGVGPARPRLHPCVRSTFRALTGFILLAMLLTSGCSDPNRLKPPTPWWEEGTWSQG